MFEVLGLAALAMMGLLVVAVILAGWLLVKAVFFVITLPFRILFAALFVPLWIAKTIVRLVLGIVLLPVMLVGGFLAAAVAALGALVLLLAPLVPIAIIGLLLWVVVRRVRPVTV